MLIEVGRMAHELAERHGWNAHKYAAKMAAEALAAGEMEEHDFWKMVELSLTPRLPTVEHGSRDDANGLSTHSFRQEGNALKAKTEPSQ
jgi:hypothetical protein